MKYDKCTLNKDTNEVLFRIVFVGILSIFGKNKNVIYLQFRMNYITSCGEKMFGTKYSCFLTAFLFYRFLMWNSFKFVIVLYFQMFGNTTCVYLKYKSGLESIPFYDVIEF